MRRRSCRRSIGRSPCSRCGPGQIARRTHDYTRHGTARPVRRLRRRDGKVLGAVTRQHRGADFVRFLAKIDRTVPRRRALHLVLDNRSTHKTPEVTAWLAAHARFTLHFTPTSASWLNAVEGWFGQLERRASGALIHQRE